MSVRGPRELSIDLGVFLLPLLLVKGTAIMMSEPKEASATTPIVSGSAGIDSLDDYRPEWTLQQLVAADYIAELRGLPFGPSPLLHIVKRQSIPDSLPNPNGDGDGDGNETNVVVPPPDVTVGGIMRSRNGNVAIINHRYYRVGDALGSDGWVVKSINAETRSVVVEFRGTGREATLHVPLPR